ncbi:MAG: SRPBCC family protein [Acidobacteriota bacterium]|nr:SRPBCC family protein [Blastocatellia bacterium]MDW8239162.1 SRPBCC family protein [Acidobacteriota bacterium]
MTVAVSTVQNRTTGHSRSNVTSRIELVTLVAAPPERVWSAVRDFDSKSTKGLLTVLHQETNKLLVYSVSGLPKTIKTMIGEIQLEPSGSGTRLRWSVQFSTKRTMVARLLRPMLRHSIERTLRDGIKRLKEKVTVIGHHTPASS